MSRKAAVRLGAAWAVLIAAGTVGFAFMPVLLAHAPLWLIALSPLPRHLLLVVPKVDFVPFVTVAALRREALSVLWYLTGRTYGERGIRWFEGRYVRVGRLVRGAERLFSRASLPLLMISPNPLFCVLAGAWGVRPHWFLPLTLLGHALWISATYQIGQAFAELIAPITAWIVTHAVQLTLVTLLLAGGVKLARTLRRRGEASA